jgi:hypothetical protein
LIFKKGKIPHLDFILISSFPLWSSITICMMKNLILNDNISGRCVSHIGKHVEDAIIGRLILFVICQLLCGHADIRMQGV